MPYQIGNTYGKHNNHYKGGRLTKEQVAALAGLVPTALNVWKTILELPVKPKGMSVQAEVASKVLNKFIADLSEQDVNITGADIIADFIKCVEARSSKSAEGLTPNTGDSGDNGAVPK
jgi:hypothetical protein